MPQPPSPPPATALPTGRRWWIGAAVVTAACMVAYANSFRGEFLLDDIPEILDNRHLDRLVPPWEAMFVGNKLPARPLPYLSFALNRFVCGADPRGFHAVNLLIHVAAALALFDLVRLTLNSPRLRPRMGSASLPLAALAATIWAVHPLNTQAVTYIYQRIESLAGLFMLVTLACYARWADRVVWRGLGAGQGWLAASVAAAAAAMATKEHAVVLPLLVWLYDWIFVASNPSAPRGRWRFHGILALTWLVLAAVMISQAADYQEFDANFSHAPWAYALTESGVILHYLRLVFWPVGQCFDYGWPIERSVARALPATLALAAAVVGTAIGIGRRAAWAFPAAVFFLVLAPTSSIFPVYAPCYEYRMYVPGAAVIATACCLVYAAISQQGDPHVRRRVTTAGCFVAASMAAVLTSLTVARNAVYAMPSGVWREVLAMRPGNVLANTHFAGAASKAGDLRAALEHGERVVRTESRSQIFGELADAFALRGDRQAAVTLCQRDSAVKSVLLGGDAKDALESQARLITALHNAGQPEAYDVARDSLAALEAGLGLHNQSTLKVLIVLAKTANASGRPDEGERWARTVLAALDQTVENPAALRKPAAVTLAESLGRQGRPADAEQLLRLELEALGRLTGRRRTDLSPLVVALAAHVAAQGRNDEARDILRPTLEGLTASLGTDHPATAAARQTWDMITNESAKGPDR